MRTNGRSNRRTNRQTDSQTDRQTDRQADMMEVIGAFRDYEEPPKKEIWNEDLIRIQKL